MTEYLRFRVEIPGEADLDIRIHPDVYTEVTGKDWQDNHIRWAEPHQAAAHMALLLMDSGYRWKLNQWDGCVGFPDDAATVTEVRLGERLNFAAVDLDEMTATPIVAADIAKGQ